MTDNKINRPVLLIGLTIVFVIILAHFFNGVTIFGYQIKPVDLFMDIKPDSLLSSNSEIDIKKSPRQNMITETASSQTSGYTNNLAINGKALAASINYDLIDKALEKSGVIIPEANYEIQGVPNTNVQIAGNVAQMKYFFDAVRNSKNSQVRIAHYGDSGVEGDAITSDIRKTLQAEFGGAGVGFLSITSQDITFRITTRQSFSDNWKTVSVLTANPYNVPLGVNGFVAIPGGSSWVKYETTDWAPELKTFGSVKLFYSNAKNSSIKYSFNGGAESSATLNPGSNIKNLVLSAPGGSASSVKITTTMADQAYFYGVSLESGNGVYVDNFPWRGNTGLGFNKLSESALQQFGQLLNYKLIILEFGANEVTFGTQDNTWFSNQMIKEINNLQKAFPQTSILLICVGDKSIKKGTKFVTDPSIPVMNKVQQNIAAKTGIAYWDCFEAMGGYNAMEAWVKANPPLALMDYTHPTWQGASKIGQMIAKAILDSYKNYK